MPGVIRTRNPSKRAVANPRLRPRGQWDRRTSIIIILNKGLLRTLAQGFTTLPNEIELQNITNVLRCVFLVGAYRQRSKSMQHTCAWTLVWIGSERWVGSWSVWTPTFIPCSFGMTSVATRQSSTVRIVSRVVFRSAASRGCIQALQLVERGFQKLCTAIYYEIIIM